MADLKSRLLKEIYVPNLIFEDALKVISFPKENFYWLSWIVVQFRGRRSKGEQIQVDGNLFSPPFYHVSPSCPS